MTCLRRMSHVDEKPTVGREHAVCSTRLGAVLCTIFPLTEPLLLWAEEGEAGREGEREENQGGSGRPTSAQTPVYCFVSKSRGAGHSEACQTHGTGARNPQGKIQSEGTVELSHSGANHSLPTCQFVFFHEGHLPSLRVQFPFVNFIQIYIKQVLGV